MTELKKDGSVSVAIRCLLGYNSAVLAYGQTGSGKTYTMGTAYTGTGIDESVGLIPRTISYLFHEIESLKIGGSSVEISVQFLEVNYFTTFQLYNEDIFDLLDTNNRGIKSIKIHENNVGGICIQGCTQQIVLDCDDVLRKLSEGTKSRITASTNMNLTSSRSHAIFTLIVTQIKNELDELSTKLSSKFHLVDLAGSERLSRTGAIGDRAKEAISINSGLLALGNVINALSEKCKRGGHVPYRDSKLTRLLQDSLGGNSFTIMVACISPSDRDMSETISTLNYAVRAKNIKNKISVNQEVKHKRNLKIMMELDTLRKKLATESEQLEHYRLLCEFYEKKYGPISLERKSEVSLDSKPDNASTQKSSQLVSSFDLTDSVPELISRSVNSAEFSSSQVEMELHFDDSEDLLDSKLIPDAVSEDLIEVNANIAHKEEVIKELEDRQRKFDQMKEFYELQIEFLNTKIEELSKKELDDIQQVENHTQNSEQIIEIRQKYHEKIRVLTDELKSVRTQHQGYQHKTFDNELVGKQLFSLKNELADLKTNKVSLTRALRKEITCAQKREMDYVRKLKACERDANKKEMRIKNLMTEKEKTSNVLKRKLEELQAAKRINRPKLGPALTQTSTDSLPISRNLEPFIDVHAPVLNTETSSSRHELLLSSKSRLCYLESPAISGDTKNKWKVIEEQIKNLLIKKETLTIMNNDIDKLILERGDISREIASLKIKLEGCPKRSIKRTQEKIQRLEETLETLQQSIQNEQKEVAEIEINDSTETAIELFKTCKKGEDLYIFRNVFNYILRNIDEIVDKNIKLKQHEFEIKHPKKRAARKATIDEPENILIDVISKRRKTALPSEITKSLLGTPMGVNLVQNIPMRRITRNMSKAIPDPTKMLNEPSEYVNSQEDSNSNESKENTTSRKRQLL
ncbi:hypothetical protein MXB_509, partial [Myxobolus squamalis]